MSKLQAFSGLWGLVTGASSGFGVEFAKQLWHVGVNLVLVARRKDRLDDLKKVLLETERHTSCDCILIYSYDLSDCIQRTQLFESLQQQNVLISILINNAGVGLKKEFRNIEWNGMQQMIDLNVRISTYQFYCR